MTYLQLLSLIGVPSVCSACLIALFKWSHTKFSLMRDESTALKRGMTALLRDRMLQSYRYCERKGFSDIADKENFESLYAQYHALGGNGVMTKIYEKMLALPDEEQAQ